MTDFIAAFGLMLVFEGLFYALSPDGMKRMMAQMQSFSSSSLRMAGLSFMVAGIVLVWIVRH